MSGEIEIMDDNDWDRIEKIIKGAIKPLDKRMGEFNTRMDNLPCSDHTTSIITLEAQREAKKEQKVDVKNSRDWLVKVILVIAAVGGFLQAIGFFRSLTK